MRKSNRRVRERVPCIVHSSSATESTCVRRCVCVFAADVRMCENDRALVSVCGRVGADGCVRVHRNESVLRHVMFGLYIVLYIRTNH